MPLDRSFLRSFYLTTALALACLGFVNLASHFTAVVIMAVLVGCLLIVAYRAEGRWALNRSAALVVDLLIAGGTGIYFADWLFTVKATEREDMNWLVLFLPRLGLFLVVLLMAYLFRAKKPADYRKLHLLDFMMVALSCYVDSDFLLGLLLLGYLVCALWSLSCFYLYAEQATAEQSRLAFQPNRSRPAPAVDTTVVPWRLGGLGLAARRLVWMGAVGVVLYLLTPRYLATSLDSTLFRTLQLQTGLGDALMDLNRVGTVKVNSAIAFTVEVRDAAGQPKLDLDRSQRWRGRALNHYEGGRWSYPSGLLVRPPHAVPPEKEGQLPDLGPSQYFLTFHFPRRAPSRPVLVEPVALPPEPDVPVVFFPEGRGPLCGRRQPDGELREPALFHRRDIFCNSYRQVTVPAVQPGYSPPVTLSERAIDIYCHLPPLPGLQPWTDQLLQKMVDQQRLDAADVRRGANGLLPPENHEKVARALETYLAASGDYTYSLELLRRDRQADPVVDFLCNVKVGHCERFASGLAVLLRLQGIPARVVVGYSGVESEGGGRYHVRQSHAHSWVEALVSRRGADGQLEQRWLTLDPTPHEELGSGSMSGLARWWLEVRVNSSAFWSSYVVDFNAEQQEVVLTEVSGRLALRQRWQAVQDGMDALGFAGRLAYGLASLLVLSSVLWLVRRRKQRQSERAAAPRIEVAFFARLLKVVARRCRLEPSPAQTAREFAEVVARHLRQTAPTQSVAHVPDAVAELFYRVRYAGQSLSAEEQRAVEAQIEELETALRGRSAVAATVANGTGAA